MKNQVIQLDKMQGREIAQKYFVDMCGYNRGNIVPQKKIEKSLKTLENIYDRIKIQVLVSEYEKSCVDGKTMLLDGEVFTCKALSKIPQEEIKKVYIYLLTAGEPDYEETSILNEVYYDMWQTAYVYAGKEILKQYLQKLSHCENEYISDSFGPGFYGMDVSQLKQFFAILDGEKIQIRLLENGFMLPVKSYAGFFVITDSPQNLPDKDCENCLSGGKTCMYCKAGSK